MTELAIHNPDSLILAPEQTRFTDNQIAALRHIGVENASDGDLAVFFNHCQRTGLDPFIKQIYMICRKTKQGPKQTIQTGIDGFRVIGRRAADRAGDSISLSEVEWAHEDGSWRPVWSRSWGYPVAARITIYRSGDKFPAVALWDEYKQTQYGGALTSMWETRPAGQLAKCAEALAWRKAFPHDLSGIYTDDEMGQADNPTEQPKRGGLRKVLTEPINTPDPNQNRPTTHLAELNVALIDFGYTTPEDKLAACSEALGREVSSPADLTEDEARQIIDALPDVGANTEGES